MILNTDFRSPVELSGVARAAVDSVSGNLPLSRWLPNQEVTSLTYEYDVAAPTQDTARYRAFDTPAPYSREPSTLTKSGKIPPISQKSRVSEYDQLLLAGRRDEIGAVLERYAQRDALDIAFRLELARAQVLLTGAFTLDDENGLTASVEFGRDASLSATLTGNAKWSNTASDPVAKTLEWRNLVRAQKEPLPSEMLVTTDVADALSVHPTIIGAYFGRTDNLTSRITYANVAEVYRGFGIILTVIDQAYQTVGLGTPAFPAGTVLLLPGPGVPVTGGSLGDTEIGVPAEALKPSHGIPEGERAGLFAGAFSKSDPEGLDVLVSAIAMPTLKRPNATFAGIVL